MKSFSHLSKALTMSTLATLLLVAATGNQVALGAASPTTAITPATASPAQSEMWWAAITDYITQSINGQFSGPVVVGTAQPIPPNYHATDFSAFD